MVATPRLAAAVVGHGAGVRHPGDLRCGHRDFRPVPCRMLALLRKVFVFVGSRATYEPKHLHIVWDPQKKPLREGPPRHNHRVCYTTTSIHSVMFSLSSKTAMHFFTHTDTTSNHRILNLAPGIARDLSASVDPNCYPLSSALYATVRPSACAPDLWPHHPNPTNCIHLFRSAAP